MRDEHGFELTRVELELARLEPAHDGLRVVQLSDVHVGRQTPAERIRNAVRAVNELQPDLVLLTGDYVTWPGDPVEEITEQLGGLRGRVLATLGNHDHIVGARRVRRALERAGYRVLQNEHHVEPIREVELTVVGVDDGGTFHDDVSEALRGTSASTTRLVLAHTPRTALKLPPDEGLVCFSGHTHGGAVMVPKLTEAIFRLARQPFVRGHYDVKGNQLYVNRGLGFGGSLWSPRVSSPPEVTLFSLRRAAAVSPAL